MNADDKLGIAILMGITAALFVLGFWIRWRESIPRKWPQSLGAIITSTTVRQPTGRGGDEVTPLIEYEFNFQGQVFRSTHWSFGNYSTGNSISAGEVTLRYPVGSSVTVYVNQQHPQKSILEAGPSSLCWVPFGFGLFFLVISVLVILMVITK